MKPVDFEEVNLKLGEHQPEYQTLPVHWDSTVSETPVTSCWELTDEELEILFKTKRLYIQQLTFGGNFQPQLPLVYKPLMEED